MIQFSLRITNLKNRSKDRINVIFQKGYTSNALWVQSVRRTERQLRFVDNQSSEIVSALS